VKYCTLWRVWHVTVLLADDSVSAKQNRSNLRRLKSTDSPGAVTCAPRWPRVLFERGYGVTDLAAAPIEIDA